MADLGRHGPAWEALAPALHRAELSMGALYLRYVALGGSATSASLADHFVDGRPLATGEHDLAVLAINERFLELRIDDPLPYIE
jgi:hypothetical protein